MKKLLPFVFPAAAFVLVAFLAFRWYGNQIGSAGDIAEFGEGVEIEELTQVERDRVMKGAGDYKTVDLEGADDVMGQVRYEMIDGKVRFSISASLPELESGFYQVWLKAVDSEAIREAFVLNFSKGGYLGSAAISEETLPFEVLVTQELVDDAAPETTVLKGFISK
jgi:hypothetical protein